MVQVGQHQVFLRNSLIIHAIVFSSHQTTDYGHPERKQPSLHGRKFNPNPKFLGTAEAYFVCHIVPIFQISLIYAFIGCPQSVFVCMQAGVIFCCTWILIIPNEAFLINKYVQLIFPEEILLPPYFTQNNYFVVEFGCRTTKIATSNNRLTKYLTMQNVDGVPIGQMAL